MTRYLYRTCGTDVHGKTWEVSGSIEIGPQEFHLAFNRAMSSTFQKLTNGDAVFGQPGVGCDGPYTVARFLLKKENSK